VNDSADSDIGSALFLCPRGLKTWGIVTVEQNCDVSVRIFRAQSIRKYTEIISKLSQYISYLMAAI